MRLRLSSAFLAAIFVASASAADAAPAGPQGRWLTASGNVIVDVEPCGAELCGVIVKVLANRSMEGGSRPMAAGVSALGVKVLSGLRRDGDHWAGRLYNRETGKTYDCQLSTPTPDQLVVRAYVGLPLFGKTQVWRRQG